MASLIPEWISNIGEILRKDDIVSVFEELTKELNLIQPETNLSALSGGKEQDNDNNDRGEAALRDIPKRDASKLTMTELKIELEQRGLPIRGFFSDDTKRLQECMDREYQEIIHSKQVEWQHIEAIKIEERQRQSQRKMQEEEDEISKNYRLGAWFQLLLQKSSPLHCRIDITDVSARSLAKLLWCDTRVVSIDVSNMDLSDEAGAYLAYALGNNSGIVRVEMGGNEFGSLTCKTLARSLLKNRNSRLNFLSLESNLLEKGSYGKEGVELLADAISKNSTLISLSLWRCGIGVEGGRALAKAVSENSTLISVEVGYNYFDHLDILTMVKQMEKNTRQRELKLAKQAELDEEQRISSHREGQEVVRKQKENEEEEWLAKEKKARAEGRRLQLEQEQQMRQMEEIKERRMKEIKKLEEARVQEALKKSKGKEKAKKK